MLKVLSYNIQEGGDGRLVAIGRIIRAQRLHLVALLEASSRANTEALAGDAAMHLVDEHVAAE
jgi:hypothetical protein